MQFEFNFRREHSSPRLSIDGWMQVGARRVKLRLVRNRHARRYVLRLSADGAARVTVPRGGSVAEAKRFAQRNEPWLERQLLRQAIRPTTPRPWFAGTEILFRGQPMRLEPGSEGEKNFVRLGQEVIEVKNLSTDLRREVECHLWRLAGQELRGRVHALARLHQVQIERVCVRNQRSRWGSCSRRGTISLNWRLVQAPPFVRDYIILHELAHVKEMNHSSRFWREVARLCPGFKTAEQWLKQNRLLNW